MDDHNSVINFVNVFVLVFCRSLLPSVNNNMMLDYDDDVMGDL